MSSPKSVDSALSRESQRNAAPAVYAQMEGHIAVDEEDTSSDYDDSLQTELTSIASSIVDYVYENGRRYHSQTFESKYLLPNDEVRFQRRCPPSLIELFINFPSEYRPNKTGIRLDLNHHEYLLVLDGRLTIAPISKGIQKVLDIGTGTGIWAIDMADTYPSAEVIGTDLSPIQPSWVPPNCRFEVDDAEKAWMWKENTFDFIHSRNLTQSIRDWPNLCTQMYKHIKPGGYVELVELAPDIFSNNDSLPADAKVMEFLSTWKDAAKKMGLPQPNGLDLKKHLMDAGFTDLQYHPLRQPIGSWPQEQKMKEIGQCQLLQYENIIHTYGIAMLTRVAGMSLEDATALCDAAKKDCFTKKYQLYLITWFIVGKKPESEEA